MSDKHDAKRADRLAALQRIEWDDEGYCDFHDADGFHRCPVIATSDNGGGVLVIDFTDSVLTPVQARAFAARLIACADEAEAGSGGTP